VKNRPLIYLTNKLKDTHLKELLKGSSIAFAFRIIGMITGYIFTLLITRNFGAGAMGVFALSITVLTVFSVIGRLGFDTALLRFVAEYSSQSRRDLVREIYLKTIMLVVPLTLLLSFLLFLSSPFIAKHIFHKEYLGSSFRLVSFALLPMVLIFINSESLRGLKKIREYSFLLNVSIPLFATIILTLTLLFAKGKNAPIFSYIISVIFVSVLSFLLWQRNAKLREVSSGKSLKLKTLLNVSLPLLLSSSLFLIMQWTDTIMLGMFRTEAEVGIYNVALKVAGLTSVTLFAINSIAAPKFAEFYGKGDIKGLGKVAQQSTKLIFWTSFPILLVFLLFPWSVLGIFGAEFKSGVYALIILTLGQFVNAVSGSVGYILQMTGKQTVFQNIIIVAATINLILNAVLIPQYGINGAALASMISMTFWNLSSLFYLRVNMKINTLYCPFVAKEEG